MDRVEPKRKLLYYSHYYYPDIASSSQMNQDLAEGLSKDFDVTVISTVPSSTGVIEEKYKKKRYYEENINGLRVIRIRVPEFSKKNKISRVKNMAAYFFGAMRANFRVGKQDVVFSVSQPPIMAGILGSWSKLLKKARFVYNIQDFNPEQTIAVGYSKNKMILKLMMLIDKHSCRRSDLIVVPGYDLVERMHIRFPNKCPKTIMINNWVDDDRIFPLDESDERVVSFKKQYGLLGKFVIMYSGNIGLYYDLENIIRVIGKFKNYSNVVFAFVGEGTKRDYLFDYVKNNQIENVVFIPFQVRENMIYSLNSADVHWCINAAGIKGVSCPSKYYGIAAVSKPVLAVLEEGTEIRSVIEKTKGGLLAAPGDYKKIEENIKWFINNASNSEIKEMGLRGYEYLSKNLRKQQSIDKYIQAIKTT